MSLVFARQWDHLVLEERQFPATENQLPASPAHLIGLHLEGVVPMVQRRDGQVVERVFRPGDLVIIPAGMENYCAHTVPAQGLYLNLDPAYLGEIALHHDLPVPGLKTHFGEPDPNLQHLLLCLAEEARAPGLGGTLYVQALTQQLMIHLLRRYTVSRPLPDPLAWSRRSAYEQIKPALALMQAQFGDDLSLETLAAATHLSPFHFSRVFKEATGQSPHQYLIALRIEQARQLLQAGNMNIAEVAVTVGFSDQSHLTRHFKRLTGLTPKQVYPK